MACASKCPVCGSQDFYVKDPADEYETYAFQCRDGQIVYGPPGQSQPQIENDTEAFCDRCSWHGEYYRLEE